MQGQMIYQKKEDALQNKTSIESDTFGWAVWPGINYELKKKQKQRR